MLHKRFRQVAMISICAAICGTSLPALAQNAPRHNVIIFIADGMRHGAVDETNTPTMAQFRKTGVDFVNSHSLFPTVTTPNASAIATGHYIGDTGNFANKMYMGTAVQDRHLWEMFHDAEDNLDIREANEHFAGNYLTEDSLIAAARKILIWAWAVYRHDTSFDPTRGRSKTAVAA